MIVLLMTGRLSLFVIGSMGNKIMPGFLGAGKDKKTLALKPVISWVVVDTRRNF